MWYTGKMCVDNTTTTAELYANNINSGHQEVMKQDTPRRQKMRKPKRALFVLFCVCEREKEVLSKSTFTFTCLD